jgi:L-ascorbate metabolism protein UlaG (beta-lactamase superfamily)
MAPTAGESPTRPGRARPRRIGRELVRRRTLVVALLAAAAAALAIHTGWTSSPRPWRQATGWERVPGAPAPAGRLTLGDERIGLTWLGHSGFLLEWRGSRLLLDPDTRDRCTIARRVLEPGLAAAELGAIDAALISHAHFDHLDLPTLAAVPRLARVVVPAGSESYVEPLEHGRTTVIGLDEGQLLTVGELEVVAVPAVHNGSRWHPLASPRHAAGYVVRAGGESLYFAGDTGRGPHFAAIRRAYRPRLAILPIGAYSPAFPMLRYHLSPEDAVAAARELGVERVMPCHFGTFALALDRPAAALPRFARAALEAGMAWSMPSLAGEPTESADAD